MAEYFITQWHDTVRGAEVRYVDEKDPIAIRSYIMAKATVWGDGNWSITEVGLPTDLQFGYRRDGKAKTRQGAKNAATRSLNIIKGKLEKGGKS